jgi:hypothetical protein
MTLTIAALAGLAWIAALYLLARAIERHVSQLIDDEEHQEKL